MDFVARALSSLVSDSFKEMTDGHEMFNEDQGDLSKRVTWEDIDRKSVQKAVSSFLRSISAEDEGWVVKQAKRKRQKEDIYNNNPSFDPIFMKI